jgi:Transcriptional regulator, AbiEi antitoxin
MDEWQSVADSHGLLSAADARRAGLSSRDLTRLVKGEALVQLGHGWYCLPRVLGEAQELPWELRRRRHAAQTWAALRAFDGRVVASHHSGLVLHGLPTFAADLRQVHVTRVASRQSRRRRGLTVHQSVIGAEMADGVIGVADACMGVGCINGSMAALIAADAALHRHLITQEDLEAAATRRVGPGSAAARIASLADGRAESPGETRLRHAFRLMGYAVTPQFVIEDGSFLAIVDFMLDDYGVAFEFDGFVKYGRRDPLSTHVTPADIVVAEKIREDNIRELDYGMGRVIWSELDNLVLLRRKVERTIDSARRRSA